MHTYPEGDDPSHFLSYDIADNTWTEHPNPMKYGWLSATDDTPVIFADRGAEQSQWFDQASDEWVPLPDNPYWTSDAGYPAWTGEAFIVSTSVPSHLGQEPPFAKLASLDASLQHWTDLGVSDVVGPGQHAVGDLVVWPDPGYMNGGGEGDGDWGGSYPAGGIYDPETREWTRIPPRPPGDGGVCCAAVTDDLISIYGALLNPVTLEWTEVPTPEGGERNAAAIASGADQILVWGGVVYNDPDQELLDTGFIIDTEP